MSNENTPVENTEDDLDLFSADFFGQKEAEDSEPTNSEDVEDTEVEDEPQEEAPEEDTLAPEDDSEDEEAEENEPEPAPAPKKNRAQERIEELNGKFRSTERQLQEALAEIEKLKTVQNPPKQDIPVVEDTGPTPNDKLEDGSEKYPLGEFDPNYIRDLARHSFQQEKKADDLRKQEEARAKEETEQKQALEKHWQEKLEPARERYPDLAEKVDSLEPVFANLEPNYGQYLAGIVMGMEFGPDVLYYLANNPDEAVKIVNSGPSNAARQLYHLEARFVDTEEKKTKRPKVSEAPPPPSRLKGAAPVIPEVPGDTDDLDAFESEFFQRKRR